MTPVVQLPHWNDGFVWLWYHTFSEPHLSLAFRNVK